MKGRRPKQDTRKNEKLFIVKKYVKATSAVDAIKKEKKLAVDDVYVDNDWTNGKSQQLAEAVGFQTQKQEEDE